MNPLVGFRAWRLHADHSLRSTMYWRHVWTVGAGTTAVCLRHVPCDLRGNPSSNRHHPPGRGCSCGLYARTDPAGVIEEYPLYPRSHRGLSMIGDMCMGAVLMTGEVAWGDRVIRAAEARPLCLCEPETEIDPQRWARLEAIARDNRIPIVPWAHVADYASEFGDLPRTHRAGSSGTSLLRAAS